MRSIYRRALLCFCPVLAFNLLHGSLSAAVTVLTSDGREISGEVDDQTDDRHLWIRQENEQIQLSTSIRWDSIISATDGDVQLPLEQLPELLSQRITSSAFGFLVQQVAFHAPKEPLQSVRSPRVRSLDVQALLVNLDRDVEPDGLDLLVAALDEHGQPVPVKGNLYVRLWGERIQPHGSLVRYEKLQTWNQRVVPLDFHDGVASYPFRFRTVRPEHDWRLHSDALVNVRLGVFGQGNFEASVPVQIRHFNPVRDRLQLTRGSRFFPGELTNEGRRMPHRTHTRVVRTR